MNSKLFLIKKTFDEAPEFKSKIQIKCLQHNEVFEVINANMIFSMLTYFYQNFTLRNSQQKKRCLQTRNSQKRLFKL